MVVVVGGGIAGLSAAYALSRDGRPAGPAPDVLVLEREARFGGKVVTERLEGFVVEGGPDAFVSTKPWALELCRELGMEDRLIRADMRRRKVYVLHRGRLRPLPDGLAMMVPSRIWPMLTTPLLSPRAKLRMGLDWLLPPRRDETDESLGAFISRRLGRQAYERLVEPLMSGIYAGDGDRLSLLATFPFLREWEQEHGGLTRAAWRWGRQRRLSSGVNGRPSVFVTLRTGLAELTEALVDRLGPRSLRAGTEVTDLSRWGGRYRLGLADGTTLEADAVILATPAFVSADLVSQLDPHLEPALRDIDYVSTATVSLAYRRSDLPRDLDGHGYVIPRVEGRAALACTWTSTKFPHRAPEGYGLLRIFLGRAGQDEVVREEDARLVARARDELASTLGIRAEPVLARLQRWPRAMPQYRVGHRDRVESLRSRLASLPGLFLAGAAYDGIGLPDCIRSGRQAAAQALEHLTRSAASG
jgi:oxygen-dependent protoporphyrinogen oxidase